jgi:uncharacterized membrane protein (UPF0136 family)
MKIIGWIVFAYALVVLTGGIIGHVKAGSAMSLIMGGAFGVALLGSAWAILKRKIAGEYVAFGLLIILDAFFIFRYLRTLHFIPAGLMSLLSLAVLIIVSLHLWRKINQK